jgi:hypothetical protein
MLDGRKGYFVALKVRKDGKNVLKQGAESKRRLSRGGRSGLKL